MIISTLLEHQYKEGEFLGAPQKVVSHSYIKQERWMIYLIGQVYNLV
jgi:hypothetical protein